MKINRRLPLVVGLLLGAAVGVVGYSVGRARAAGIPTPPAMTYSGTLMTATGATLNDTHNLQIQFWNAPTGGTTPLCLTQPAATKVDQGKFSIALPEECSNTVKANPDLWIEVVVDGSPLSRSKLGVVPYALEANHANTAVTASQAANFKVSGSLEVATGATLKGPVIRTIARAHGMGSDSSSDYDTDSGPLSSRSLTFTKTRADTGIRVSWTDNLRVARGTGDACRWEFKFNAASCANPGVLGYDVYYGGVTGMNHHRPDTMIGTCFGLAAGTYSIQVYLVPIPGVSQGDCATGWSNQYWALEAEEVY